MIKIILSIAVIAMIFSGCVGIDDPITRGHSMQINQKTPSHITTNTNNLPSGVSETGKK